MQWLSTAAAFEPALPPHCEPVDGFLLRFSSTFHTCVPTPLAFTSNALGALSIVSWLFAQLPQIYKNWSISSTSGLSIFFLLEWCLGDFANLLGALFTHQATWQVAIGAYYVFVDLCLVAQWIWYERLRHGRPVWRVRPKPEYGDDDARSGDMEEVVIGGVPIRSVSTNAGLYPKAGGRQDRAKQPARPKIIFRQPTFQNERKEDEKASSSLSATPRGTTIHRVGSSSPMPSPSPRTVLLIACLIAICQASPISHRKAPSATITLGGQPTALENAGTALSWLSTLLYLGSRLPQLFKNYRRKSTAGLSPHLFMAAFCGNLFYSSALVTNPLAWDDFGPHGGGGWAGPAGSDRVQWTMAALPFFLGAFGVLGLDASVGIQFLMYGDNAQVVVVEEDRWHRRHWRRVSGWMRGWVPSISGERDALLQGVERRHGEGYGTTS